MDRKRAIKCSIILLLLTALAPHAHAQDGIYDWADSRQLHPGIRYVRSASRAPRKMVVHGMRVDSRTPGLKLHTTSRRAQWVEGKTETNRQTTRNFLRRARASRVPMVAAVNADAFSPWPAPFDTETPTNVLGLAVSDGTLVSHGVGTPSLLVHKDGRLRIAKTDPNTPAGDVQTAVSGFGLVLVDGEVLHGDDAVHPRTGLGLSEDGRVLVLLAIDGRQPASAGATTPEVGQWLKHFGAHDGINMDGGGSTTMAWWDLDADSDDKCMLLNSPVGNGRNQAAVEASKFVPTERANGNNLGVSLRSSVALNETALHLAIRMQDAYQVKNLLDQGADVHVHDRSGRTPLHWAANVGREDFKENGRTATGQSRPFAMSSASILATPPGGPMK